MSFKRDGNDVNLLKNLQRRRVAELLSVHIPDDEAMLLNNGRYMCTVCSHRPIFDTLDTLATHRGSNKHLSNLSKFLVHQDLRNELILKRKHDSYVKTGNASINVPTTSNTVVGRQGTSSSSLLKASPYSSCCKRRRRPTDRKLILDTGSKKESKTADSLTAASNTSVPESREAKAEKNLVDSYVRQMKKKSTFEAQVEKSRRLPPIPKSVCRNPVDEVPLPEFMVTSKVKTQPPPPPPTAEQLKRDCYLLNLRRDGWKITLDGTWVKDEDAEFDSDEDAPPTYDG